jgi:hypothetical protein
MAPTAEDSYTKDAPKILEPGLERFEDAELELSVRCFLKGKHVLVDFMKLAVRVTLRLLCIEYNGVF